MYHYYVIIRIYDKERGDKMTDNELILSISDLLDKKLIPINESINRLEQRVEKIEKTVDEVIIPRLEKIEKTVDEVIIPRLEKIEKTVDEVIIPRLEKIERMQDEVILPRLEKIEKTVDEVIFSKLKKIDLAQENDILPRLRTIEACYTSTYERYQIEVEHMEAMRADMAVMKYVILEHSDKINKFQKNYR